MNLMRHRKGIAMRHSYPISHSICPVLMLFGLTLPLGGCDATHQLQVISASQTGCAPQDIQISDDDPQFNSRSWVAWCNDERFQCFGTRGSISCTAARKADPAALTESSAPVLAPAPNWVRHELKACGVVAEFPSAPNDETRDVSTTHGSAELELSIAELAGGSGATSVGCAEVVQNNISDDSALNAARDGMLKNIGGTLRQERDIVGGREILFERKGEQGLTHLLLLHDRIVIATAMPLRVIGPAAAKRFVNSIELAEAP
jgi:hypothetical protein